MQYSVILEREHKGAVDLRSVFQSLNLPVGQKVRDDLYVTDLSKEQADKLRQAGQGKIIVSLCQPRVTQ
jgi:hypothetical protein